MPKKRILEFLTYGGIGGTQQMFLEFIRHASHNKYTFYVCVLLDHNFVNEELTQMHIENTSLNMRGYWDISVWWKFYRFAKNKHVDLLRTYGLKAHIIGRIVGKLLGIPVNITSVRSTDPWRKWYHSILDYLTSGFTDLYISNSEAGEMMTHQREYIPLQKIMTIPNGIDLRTYTPLAFRSSDISATYKQQFNISPTTRIIGTIATFRKMKGHATIIDALPQIQEKIPDIKCLFVGGEFVNEKWYQEELYRYVQENHLENTIIFTGFRRDIPELLSLFDVFVLPSLWEGFPSSILEAMAMKKPVIASSVGGIPEVVKHEETGVLIPPQDSKALADAIIFLLNNPDIAVKIGQAGYNRVQDFFSIESVVARIESVYARLIEKNCVDISKEENRK